MNRSDFPKPFTTYLVDINSEGAYADRGMEKRSYPRLMPIPYRSIAPSENQWVLEPWRKNMKLYPQLYYQMDYWQFSSNCEIDGIGGRLLERITEH